MSDEAGIDIDALERKLALLREGLAGGQEQLAYTLRSTGHHIPGRWRKKQEAELEDMRKEIAECEDELRDKKARWL
jgi:uncharacterized membrane protein